MRQRLVSVAKELLEQDGATAIVAIGLSMVPSSMSADELSRRLGGVPVLDAERIAVHTAELIRQARASPLEKPSPRKNAPLGQAQGPSALCAVRPAYQRAACHLW